VLFWYLTRSHSPEASGLLVSTSSAVALLAAAGVAGARVVNERSLIRVAGGFASVSLLIAPGYWPWYAALPVALLALSPTRASIAIAIAFSLGARLTAPIDRLRGNGLMGWNEQVIVTTIIGLWVPALVILLLLLRERPPIVMALRTARWPGRRIGAAAQRTSR
jgi:hypothetical protein